MIETTSKIPALFSVPDRHRSRSSEVMLSLVEQIGKTDVTLRTLTDRLGDRTFGMLLILMAVFNLIPFVSLLSGLLVTFLGLQMAVGMTQARLPAIILDRQLPADRVRAALMTIVPHVQVIERYVRPRLHFTEAPVVDRINGSVIAMLGVVIALPIPFANLGPAMVVIIMGIGLSERDGFVQIVAACLGFAAIFFIAYLIFGHQT